LWLAIYLPNLPLQVFQRGTPEAQPLAVAEHRRIVAANPAAQRLGVRADLGLASALALAGVGTTASASAPELIVRTRDRRGEDIALREVALWAGQYTPNVSLDSPACVLLEVQASLRLFGGADALARRIDDDCRDLGFAAEVAGAPTPLAARWLARAARRTVITDEVALKQAIDRLPLDVLDCAPEVMEMLLSIGALSVEDCLRLPRAGLARRGAATLLDSLDRAAGRTPDPRPWFVPPPTYSARLELTVPQTRIETLMFGVRRLCAGLAAYLAGRHAGVERFALRLEHEDLPPAELVITLGESSRDEVRCTLLAREHFARIELAAPVRAVAIAAKEIRPLALAAETLFGDMHKHTDQVSLLVERLRARLGREAVQGLQPAADHRPEHAWRHAEPGPAKRAGALPALPRPLWLLPQPRRLATRENFPCLETPLRLVAGPERIESGWWDAPGATEARRDYFIAAGSADELLWVYRELTAPDQWYLHGIFA